MRFAIHTLFAAVLLSALAGCGSSGGGTTIVTEEVIAPDLNALFMGEYQHVAFLGEQDGVESMRAFWGSLAAAGDGTSEIFQNENSLGVINPAVGTSPIDYQIGFNHVMTMGEFVPGFGFLRGGITSDGRVAALTSVFDGVDPTLWMFGRRGPPPHDDTSVQGTWRFARYTSNIAIPLNVSGWGSITFDGMGAGTFEESNNQETATFGPINPPFTYEVLNDGRIGLLLGPGNLLIGSIVEGGQAIIAGGSNVPGEPPSMYVFVREAAGLSDADFAGNYQLLAFGHDSASNAYWSVTAGMVADGAGVNTFVGLRNEDGTTTATGADGVFSSVAANGEITFTTPGGDTYAGAMTQDGSVVIGAGATNAGGDPAFFLFLK